MSPEAATHPSFGSPVSSNRPGPVAIVRIAVALVLIAVAVGAIAMALNHLVRAGTCASGGAYEIARKCPGGTGAWMFAIPPALLTLFIAPWLSGYPDVMGRLVWVGGFVALGLDALVLLLGGTLSNDGGSRFGALVLAITFLSMALVPALYVGIRTLRRRGEPEVPAGLGLSGQAPAWGGSSFARSSLVPSDLVAQLQSISAQAVAQQASAPAPSEAHEDPLDRLQQLADMRTAGVLTEAEFQEQKARILRLS